MSLVLANVAVPMFFPHPFVAALALLPVVGLETLMLRKRVGATLYQVFTANLLSALWGVPLALVCVFVFGAGFGVFIDLLRNTLPGVALVFLVLVLPCFVLSNQAKQPARSDAAELVQRFGELGRRKFNLAA